MSSSNEAADQGDPYLALHKLQGGERGNLTGAVEQALRDAIVTLAFEPGAMLDKQAICERMGVSRFPVSAALTKLAAAGLVEVLPQRGTRVRPVVIHDIRQHLFIRSALEVETVRSVALACRAATLDALAQNLEKQREAVGAAQRHTFHRLDLAFHEIMLDEIALPRVKEIVTVSRSALDRARQLIATPERLTRTLDEHQRIYDAIRGRDIEAAARAMHGHLDQVVAELRRFAAERPDLVEE
ncbi:GntR family transcriptional regulator [Paraburkholderia rhizosphaerae]|uniref:DNA-binding GntR family transcriptional regulator n=1 Tax=Paraburkholderia rhizosphaerae TaxID=480658 RepID=A0A4R8LBS6_9BURK|nr:GntR family transcriptional regulator [Paraburkholderia rhizosphaerae]TDY40406.1 DNA-binding GntR family transcriptional regulator [Paraburkholderia rhizosphaerae]